MKKEILSEINRVREIMGLQIISEDSLPSSLTQKLLKKLFSVDAIKNIDPRTLRDLVTTSISKGGADATNDVLQRILLAIRDADWNNSVLDEIPFNILFKELIKTANTQVKQEMKASIRQSLKEIFPQLDELATESELLLRKFTPTLAIADPDLYNETLTQLRSLKKILEKLDIDKEYKKLLIDAYKLNDLPLNDETAKYIISNKNVLRDKIRELFTTKYDTKRGSTDIDTGGITVTAAELKELEDYAAGKINNIEDLSEPLFNKMLPVLQKNEDFLKKYLDNFLNKIGFTNTKGVSDLGKYSRDIMSKTSKKQTWEDIIENEVSETDLKILRNVFDKEFTSISAVIRLASQVQTYPDKTVAQKVTKMLNEVLLPKLKILGSAQGAEYVKYFIENFGNRMLMTFRLRSLQDIENLLNKELQIMAKNILNNKTIEANLDTIKNLVVLLNQSDLSKKGAKEWLETELKNSGIDDEKLKIFLDSKEFKELYENLGIGFRENFTKLLGQMFRGYGEMSIILNIKRWRDIAKAEGGANKALNLGLLFSDFAQSFARFALTTDPSSVQTYRNIIGLAGTGGVWVDRGVKLLFWKLTVYPWVMSFIEGTRKNDAKIQMATEFEKIQKLLCEPLTYEGVTLEKIGTDDECAELSKVISDVKTPLNGEQIRDSFRPTTVEGILEMGGIITNTYIDDIQRYLNRIYSQGLFFGGSQGIRENLIADLESEIISVKNKYDNVLKNEYCYNSDNGKRPEANMFECLKNKRKQRQGERSVEGKYSDDDLGWAKFALDNGFTVDKGFTVGDYIEEDGKGIITQPDGTQVPYFWNGTKETFEL
jgi:hypothetical protein